MSRIVSKPSSTYAANFAAIFGDKPKPPPEQPRTYRAYDPAKGQVVDLADKPRRRLGVAQWPLWSDAFGVHPSDAQRAYEASVAEGVPTEFCTETGRAKFNDRHHRNRAISVLGDGRYFDLDGGYSDPQPTGKKIDGDYE